MTKKLECLEMPEGSKALIDAHAAAERGEGYEDAQIEAVVDTTCSVLKHGGFGFFSSLAAYGAMTKVLGDPTAFDMVVGVVVAIVAGFTALMMARLLCFDAAEVWRFIKFVFSKQVRRLPEEEEILRGRLHLAAVELDRQVGLYNTLCDEIALEEEKVEVGLPTDLDLVRVRQVAEALRDDLATKLRQLAVVIKDRNRKQSGEGVDIVALRDALGGRHRGLLAELQAEQELGGNAAADALHETLQIDALNAELGDPAAAARELLARRRQRQ